MSAAGISGYSSAPYCSPTLASGPTSGTEITVTVSVPCSKVSWLGTATLFQGQTLSSSVTMMEQ